MSADPFLNAIVRSALPRRAADDKLTIQTNGYIGVQLGRMFQALETALADDALVTLTLKDGDRTLWEDRLGGDNAESIEDVAINKIDIPVKTAATGTEARLELGLSGDFVAEFAAFLAWVRDQAQMGTGVTITATTNGGDQAEVYVDGDGPDRINGISLDGSSDVSSDGAVTPDEDIDLGFD